MDKPCFVCLTRSQIYPIATERNLRGRDRLRKKELYEILFGEIFLCSEHSEKDGEVWKLVPGMSKYKVSSLGRLRNVRTLNLSKGWQNREGYAVYSMTDDHNIEKSHYAHRIVAQTFIENPHNYKFVDHIDHNRSNNVITNLRWVTHQMNCLNRKESGNKRLGSFTSIQQFDRSGKFIKTWESITEAAEFYEISSSTINGVLRGARPTAAGYKWKYTKDEIEGEIWKPIPIDGLKHEYMVSDQGRILNPSTRKKTCGTLSQEYCRTGLTMIDGKKVNYLIHRLVMITFANDQNNNGLIVNHKDTNRSNNFLTNLEWATHSQNVIHGLNSGLVSSS